MKYDSCIFGSMGHGEGDCGQLLRRHKMDKCTCMQSTIAIGERASRGIIYSVHGAFQSVYLRNFLEHI